MRWCIVFCVVLQAAFSSGNYKLDNDLESLLRSLANRDNNAHAPIDSPLSEERLYERDDLDSTYDNQESNMDETLREVKNRLNGEVQEDLDWPFDSESDLDESLREDGPGMDSFLEELIREAEELRQSKIKKKGKQNRKKPQKPKQTYVYDFEDDERSCFDFEYLLGRHLVRFPDVSNIGPSKSLFNLNLDDVAAQALTNLRIVRGPRIVAEDVIRILTERILNGLEVCPATKIHQGMTYGLAKAMELSSVKNKDALCEFSDELDRISPYIGPKRVLDEFKKTIFGILMDMIEEAGFKGIIEKLELLKENLNLLFADSVYNSTVLTQKDIEEAISKEIKSTISCHDEDSTKTLLITIATGLHGVADGFPISEVRDELEKPMKPYFNDSIIDEVAGLIVNVGKVLLAEVIHVFDAFLKKDTQYLKENNIIESEHIPHLKLIFPYIPANINADIQASLNVEANSSGTRRSLFKRSAESKIIRRLISLLRTADKRVNGSFSAQGSTGSTGVSGAQGSTGSTGVSGAQGSTGSTGVSGAHGSTGSTGVSGAQGSTGSTGVSGAQGSSGSTGVSGAQDASGAIGGSGAQGSTGAIGGSGAQGPTGSTNTTVPTRVCRALDTGNKGMPYSSPCFNFDLAVARIFGGFPRLSDLQKPVTEVVVDPEELEGLIEKSLTLNRLMNDANMVANELVFSISQLVLKQQIHCPENMLNKAVFYVLARALDGYEERQIERFGMDKDKLGGSVFSAHKYSMGLLLSKLRVMTFRRTKKRMNNLLRQAAKALSKSDVSSKKLQRVLGVKNAAKWVFKCNPEATNVRQKLEKVKNTLKWLLRSQRYSMSQHLSKLQIPRNQLVKVKKLVYVTTVGFIKHVDTVFTAVLRRDRDFLVNEHGILTEEQVEVLNEIVFEIGGTLLPSFVAPVTLNEIEILSELQAMLNKGGLKEDVKKLVQEKCSDLQHVHINLPNESGVVSQFLKECKVFIDTKAKVDATASVESSRKTSKKRKGPRK